MVQLLLTLCSVQCVWICLSKVASVWMLRPLWDVLFCLSVVSYAKYQRGWLYSSDYNRFCIGSSCKGPHCRICWTLIKLSSVSLMTKILEVKRGEEAAGNQSWAPEHTDSTPPQPYPQQDKWDDEYKTLCKLQGAIPMWGPLSWIDRSVGLTQGTWCCLNK